LFGSRGAGFKTTSSRWLTTCKSRNIGKTHSRGCWVFGNWFYSMQLPSGAEAGVLTHPWGFPMENWGGIFHFPNLQILIDIVYLNLYRHIQYLTSNVRYLKFCPTSNLNIC
jgi:hypothetical protein